MVTWSYIAKGVNKLLRIPGARERFRLKIKRPRPSGSGERDVVLPIKWVVSLAEQYAVLAAVWDAIWNGKEKIDPWPNTPWLLVRTLQDDYANSTPAGKYPRDQLRLRLATGCWSAHCKTTIRTVNRRSTNTSRVSARPRMTDA